MKRKVICTILLVVAMVCPNAWALLWSPAADGNLVFNLNFENNTYVAPPPAVSPTTTDAVAGLVGVLTDYNLTNYAVWQPGPLGTDCNFGVAFDANVDRPNDCRVRIPDNDNFIFMFGPYNTNIHTWTLWFNVPNLGDGTMIRHERTEDPNVRWEIRIFGGKLAFYHQQNSLRMETVDTLADMGITIDTWNHAAIVINRTTETSSKIYINGVQRDVVVTYYMNNSGNIDVGVDFPTSYLRIGAGDRIFEGLLDEIYRFKGELTPLQVSILYQLDGTEKPIALMPIPNSKNVVFDTNFSWDPDPAATKQTFYFKKADNDVCLAPLYSVSDNGNDMNNVTNAQMGIGLLDFNEVYYWGIMTELTPPEVNYLTVWSFRTETGKAINPVPPDGEEDINIPSVDLSWFTPTAATYDVYLSSDKSRVDANDPNFRIGTGITDNNIQDINDVNILTKGTIYYWRVNSTYAGKGMVQGDTWSFLTQKYEIVFNDQNYVVSYSGHDVNAFECVIHGAGWTKIGQGSLDANIGTAANPSDPNGGLVVFYFTDPNGFNYDSHYDIVVVPRYDTDDIMSSEPCIVPRPIAIHVTDGNFYFDGRILIEGNDVTLSTQDQTQTSSGGFPPPMHNAGEGSTQGFLWLKSAQIPAGTYTRFGLYESAKFAYEPNDSTKRMHGPGVPTNPPYKGGGGGGYGGVGGECGRGYSYAVFSGGPSYGDKEVPVSFGGSAGGWGGGSCPGGAAGGGGIEIYASGNITLDVHSEVLAHGGSQVCTPVDYAAGGGAGGSVKLVADGNITLKGIIDVNGGKGGDASSQTTNNDNDTGGGGAGGRVAIIYGGNYDKTGSTIAYKGGVKGVDTQGNSLAEDGQDGTLYEVKSSPARRKASAPTPSNNARMVYCPNTSPTQSWLTLKWYSGFNKTDACDIVYFGDSNTAMFPKGMVSAKRGQHTCPNDVNVLPDKTYYWKVTTVGNDGSTDSNTWSFKTVSWKCPTIEPNDLHVAGPVWDLNRDCAEDFADLALFAKNWRNAKFSNTLDYPELYRFANEWLDCRARTNGGCAGW
jgi:hypothetical protein